MILFVQPQIEVYISLYLFMIKVYKIKKETEGMQFLGGYSTNEKRRFYVQDAIFRFHFGATIIITSKTHTEEFN